MFIPSYAKIIHASSGHRIAASNRWICRPSQSAVAPARKKEREPFREVFRATVRKVRESRGWTQEQLAEASEMSTTYLGSLKRGENVPTLPVVVLWRWR
jgi:ribosome-binding protein aMBF1 (putative translation factor)